MAYKFDAQKINADALNQSEHWYDRSGKLYKVEEMAPKHALGAVNKLYRQFGQSIIHKPLYKALARRAANA